MITCNHYRPGDPGFEAECAKVTPLHKIRKGYSQKRNDITAESAPMPKARRNESPNVMRG